MLEPARPERRRVPVVFVPGTYDRHLRWEFHYSAIVDRGAPGRVSAIET